MNIFTSISNGLKTAWSHIQKHLTDVETSVLEFVSPLAHQIMVMGGHIITDAALAAVSAAEAKGGSGADKFTTARKTFENALKDQGKAASQNFIEAVLKAAVEKMRMEHATAPTDAVAAPSEN